MISHRVSKLVEANCSRCHAIGVTGDSPLAKAPPFRDVVTRYPPESLGEALVEGIVTGHNRNAEFVFEADQATEIIAYLDSLKAKSRLFRQRDVINFHEGRHLRHPAVAHKGHMGRDDCCSPGRPHRRQIPSKRQR